MRQMFYTSGLLLAAFVCFHVIFINCIPVQSDSDGHPCSEEGKPGEMELWATYYYIPILNHSEEGVDLLDENEKPLGFRLAICDWCKAAIEGTVAIKKDQVQTVFTFTGRSDSLQQDCRTCTHYQNYPEYPATGRVLWEKSSGLGKGVLRYNLVPFKTIAVDPLIIPYGSVVYIEEAKGVRYIGTSGKEEVHDGYFFAGDTGAKINGGHIDVFLGTCSSNPFSFISSDPGKTFKASIVQDSKFRKALLRMHTSQ